MSDIGKDQLHVLVPTMPTARGASKLDRLAEVAVSPLERRMVDGQPDECLPGLSNNAVEDEHADTGARKLCDGSAGCRDLSLSVKPTETKNQMAMQPEIHGN